MEKYVIYPIQLGYAEPDRSFMLIDTDYGKKMPCIVLSYLIVGQNELMVVDTGQTVKKFTDLEESGGPGIEGDPEDAFRVKFKELGFSFNDVTHILLTHLHWDHVGNIHLFPEAKIFVQRREVETAAAPFYPQFYRPYDIGNMISNDSHRLVFLDGDTKITAGVKAVFAGGHTLGSQLIYVNTSEGNVIITGDVVNVYENLETRSVKELDVPGWVRAVNKIKRDADIILPMHDPEVLIRYPAVGNR